MSSKLSANHEESLFETTTTTEAAAAVMDRRNVIISGLSTAALVVGPSRPKVANAAYINPNNVKITQKVYMDIEYTPSPKEFGASVKPESKQGRIVIGLYGENMPKVVDNFVELCKNKRYIGTTFYRLLAELSIQGGNIDDLTGTGKSGKSSFDSSPTFEPDNFDIQHIGVEGIISMVRNYDGSVDSRFFISTAKEGDSSWADDRYAAFGVVLDDGMNLIHSIEKDVNVKRPMNTPINPITIVDCGIL